MSRYRSSGGGGSMLAVALAAGMSALSWLVGLQAILNLQYLPSQFSEMAQSLATGLNIPLPAAAMVFFASGMVWLPIGFVIGRVTV